MVWDFCTEETFSLSCMYSYYCQGLHFLLFISAEPENKQSGAGKFSFRHNYFEDVWREAINMYFFRWVHRGWYLPVFHGEKCLRNWPRPARCQAWRYNIFIVGFFTRRALNRTAWSLQHKSARGTHRGSAESILTLGVIAAFCSGGFWRAPHCNC